MSSPVLIVNLAVRFGGVDMRVLETARALHHAGRPYAVATIANSPLPECANANNVNL